MLVSVSDLADMYQSSHLKIAYFYYRKMMFSGSKYIDNVLFNFANEVTDAGKAMIHNV